MLAGKKAIMKEIEIWEIKDVAFTLVNKREIERPAYIIMFQDMMSQTTRKNTLRSCQTLKKKLNSKKRLILTILLVMAKRTVLLLILHHS